MRKSTDLPRIRISFHKNRVVYISNSTLRCLGNPRHICIIYVEAQKQLAVEGHDEKTDESIAVPDSSYGESAREFEICRK